MRRRSAGLESSPPFMSPTLSRATTARASAASAGVRFRESSPTLPARGATTPELSRFSLGSARLGRLLDDDDPTTSSILTRTSSASSRALFSSISARSSRDSEPDIYDKYSSWKPSSSSSSLASDVRESLRTEKKLERDVLGTTLGLGTGRVEYKRSDPLAKLSLDTLLPSSSSSLTSQSQKARMADPPNEAEYAQRLLAAHSLVDDLLRSRGLDADDERKYLKSWEQMPIVREMRRRNRLRRLSSGSSDDSGCSADAEPEAHTAVSQRLVRLDDECEIEHVVTPVLKQTASLCLAISEQTLTRTHDSNLAATRSVPIPGLRKVSASFKVRPLQSQVAAPAPEAPSEPPQPKAQPKQQPQPKPQPKLPPPSPQLKEQPKPQTQNNVQLKKYTDNAGVEGDVGLRRDSSESLANALNLQLTKQRLRHAAEQLDRPQIVTQRDILAALKPIEKLKNYIRSTAEISIQHCSFYQVHERLRAVEKNVRLNLRLTERAPSKAQAKISLRAPPRTQVARLDLKLAPAKDLRRTQTTSLHPAASKYGAGGRSATIPLALESARPIRRLQIPKLFEAQGVIKPQNAKHKKALRAEAPKRRQLKTETPVVARLVEAEEKKIELAKVTLVQKPPVRSKSISCSSECAQPFAGFSEVDRLLVDRFRRHVPRPRVLRHVALLAPVQRASASPPPSTDAVRQKAQFVRRRSPSRRRSATPQPPSTSTSRFASLRIVRTPRRQPPTKTGKQDFGVALKSHSMRLMRSNTRSTRTEFIPRWRRRTQSCTPPPTSKNSMPNSAGNVESH